MKVVEEGSIDFRVAREKLLGRGTNDLDAVEGVVRQILARVRDEGDAALLSLTRQFENRTPEPLFTRDYDGQGALARLPSALRAALQTSAERIERYHQHQPKRSYRYEEDGIILGMRERAVDRAGVYAPGGKARYPSSVLMAAIPARSAGVRDIVLATPAPNDLLFAAAYLSGVTAVLDAGGAQAIGALAYGTESVPRVDKIVGPGNRYVTCAKRLVFGLVGIDGIAGPTEVLVLCDETADARIVAADLLAQAEHDEVAYPLCITTDARLAQRIAEEVREQVATLPRTAIASASVRENGLVFVVRTRETMASLAHEIAAEHVAFHTKDADELFEQVGAIGAGFVGHETPEAAGDYFAGPSHCLPTGGAARYGSPLGVYDFLARSSYIRYSATALKEQGNAITTFARAEGFEGHARGVDYRNGK